MCGTDIKGKLIYTLLAALALAGCGSASVHTLPQAKATFRSCLLDHGAVKVTLPGNGNAGHFWFRGPVIGRYDEHSGWWGIASVATVIGQHYYGAAYQVGGMSAGERRTLKLCSDRL